jgi:hypothetical protein
MTPPGPQQKLRRPADPLAGCVWLARFVDKTRLHLAGTLHPDFVFPYGHPLATDGAFFRHFDLAKEAIIEAIRLADGKDEAVSAWFLRQPGCTTERIRAWNELGPHLGQPGYPVHRGYQFMLKTYYGGQIPDPRVHSVFTAIAYDEGFLDELAGNADCGPTAGLSRAP